MHTSAQTPDVWRVPHRHDSPLKWRRPWWSSRAGRTEECHLWGLTGKIHWEIIISASTLQRRAADTREINKRLIDERRGKNSRAAAARTKSYLNQKSPSSWFRSFRLTDGTALAATLLLTSCNDTLHQFGFACTGLAWLTAWPRCAMRAPARVCVCVCAGY